MASKGEFKSAYDLGFEEAVEKTCEWIEETNRYYAPTNFNVGNYKAYIKRIKEE